MNLVNRIIQEHPDKKIISLNPYMCSCLTMNRIDLPHLAWTLESIESGETHNIIKVDQRCGSKSKTGFRSYVAKVIIGENISCIFCGWYFFLRVVLHNR